MKKESQEEIASNDSGITNGRGRARTKAKQKSKKVIASALTPDPTSDDATSTATAASEAPISVATTTAAIATEAPSLLPQMHYPPLHTPATAAAAAAAAAVPNGHTAQMFSPINILGLTLQLPPNMKGRKRAALRCEPACLRKVEEWSPVVPPKTMRLRFYTYRPVTALKKCPKNETKGNQERVFTPFDQVLVLANFDPESFNGPVWVVVEKKRKPTITLPTYPKMEQQQQQQQQQEDPGLDEEHQHDSMGASAAAVAATAVVTSSMMSVMGESAGNCGSNSGGGGGSSGVYKVWRRTWREVSQHLDLPTKAVREDVFSVHEQGEIRETATSSLSQSSPMTPCFKVEFSPGADIWIQKGLFDDLS